MKEYKIIGSFVFRGVEYVDVQAPHSVHVMTMEEFKGLCNVHVE
ncbi:MULTISPECIES: hypothetical protein [unclassified Lactonifactor]|nr:MULTISPECIES: hypothetical protein [unclassified Lactonifactor]